KYIKEKTERIIDIIISSVNLIELMNGKIVGTNLAGILQFVIWALVGGILLFIATYVFGLNTSTTATSLPTEGVDVSEIQLYFQEITKLPLINLAIYFIVYFIGGYFLY